MLEITNSAKEKIKTLPHTGFFKVEIQGGGCSGFEYKFSMPSEVLEGDHIIDLESVKVIVDKISSKYLNGAILDFKDDLMDSSFVINNPNANFSCKCGTSFSI